MARTHFYLGLQKQAAMPQGAWDKLIAIFEGTPTVLDVDGNLVAAGTPPQIQGTNDQRENMFQPRHNLNIPFDKVIYEANFNDSDITLARIRQYLANAANVSQASITTTTVFIRFAVKQSLVVTFRFNGTPMFLLVLFGRSNDAEVIDWRADSLPEVQAYLAANTAEWDGV